MKLTSLPLRHYPLTHDKSPSKASTKHLKPAHQPRCYSVTPRHDSLDVLLAMAKEKGIAGKSLIGRSLKALFFSGRDFQAATKGLRGERLLGRELAKLPEGWRVWHDLDLGGENIDHVVASAKGVFIVEVKNYKNPVLSLPEVLYTHNSKEPNNEVVAQVWRQTNKLNEHLKGQKVTPLLVFVNGVKCKEGFTGTPKTKNIPCLELDQLVPYLREQKNVLPYGKALSLFNTLDKLTK